jgi:flagellar hook protein FlgE
MFIKRKVTILSIISMNTLVSISLNVYIHTNESGEVFPKRYHEVGLMTKHCHYHPKGEFKLAF